MPSGYGAKLPHECLGCNQVHLQGIMYLQTA